MSVMTITHSKDIEECGLNAQLHDHCDKCGSDKIDAVGGIFGTGPAEQEYRLRCLRCGHYFTITGFGLYPVV